MINAKSIAIGKLKTIINDVTASPSKRIQAAIELLARFGPSQRAVPLIKSVLRTFEDYEDATNKARTVAIRTAIEQLQENLKLALRTREAQKEVEDEDESIDLSASPVSLATESPDPEPITPHQIVANPEFLGHEVSESHIERALDWHGFDGRTGLQAIIGRDLKDATAGMVFRTLVPHHDIREKLADLFEPDLPPQDSHDPYYRGRKLESVWTTFHPTTQMLDAAERRLKTKPWIEVVRDAAGSLQLHVTELGEQKRFLNFIRARIDAGVTVFGQPHVAPEILNGSL